MAEEHANLDKKTAFFRLKNQKHVATKLRCPLLCKVKMSLGSF